MSRYVPQQVNVGRIVDPISSLQDSLTSAGSLYLSALKADEEKRRFDLQEQRQAEQDARAKQLHDVKMGEVQEAKDTRDFMRGYDAKIGIGGRGVEAETQRAMAQEGGDAVTRLLSSRGIKTSPEGEGLGITEYMEQAPEEDRQKLLAGLSDVGSRGVSKLQDTATKESVRNRVFEDVLKQTGRADLAKQTADVYASDYVDRDTLKTQEAARTKEANEALKRRADTIKYAYDRRKDQADFNKDIAKTVERRYEKALSSGSSQDMVDVYKSLEDLDIGIYDKSQARKMITAARDEGFTPAEIIAGMRNMYTEGAVDRKIGADGAPGFVSELARMRESGQLNRDFRSSLQDLQAASLSPQEEQILAQASAGVKSRDLNKLLYDRGRGAFGSVDQFSPRPAQVAAPQQTTTRLPSTPSMEVPSRGVQEAAPIESVQDTINTAQPVIGDVGLDLEQEYKGTQDYYRDLGMGSTKVGMVLAGDLDINALSDYERDALKAIETRKNLENFMRRSAETSTNVGRGITEGFTDVGRKIWSLREPPAPGESIGERYLRDRVRPRLVEGASPVDTLRVPR